MRPASAALTVLLLCLAVTPGTAQDQWTFTASPAAGLWYHGLALSGAGGFGSLPLYDPAYRVTVARVRTGAAMPVTPLEADTPPLTAWLAADSALEVLHFIPLWFPAARPAELLDALGDLAVSGPRALAQHPAREQSGMRLVLASLPAPASRADLSRYVAALRRELAAGYPALHQALLPPGRVGAVADAWQPLAAALRPYLQPRGLAGGTVLLVPSLGTEGRIFAGRPNDPRDNVLAVRLGPEEPARSAALRLVRELCYPVVREVMNAAGEPADRVRGERMSGLTAVRCGHELLARYAPEYVASYDALWWDARAGDPLPPAMAEAITRRLAGS